MDGSVIEAENAVFEDRGNGNLMWTGEVSGAGYESVLFTVQDGHMVGWFGEPGGPKYVIYAGPDGSGSLAVEVGPAGDWCRVDVAPGPELTQGAAQTADRPGSAASGSHEDRLDILLLYTAGTEYMWRTIGGTAVGVKQLADYLNMVFRNGAIPATANLIPVRWDPKLANHPSTQGRHFETAYSTSWHLEYKVSAEVAAVRRRHKPDLVHFHGDAPNRRFSGSAEVRLDLEPRVYFASSRGTALGVFAHEIGHNLGGRHEPASYGDRFREAQLHSVRPYAFAHTDMTSCRKRDGWGDSLLCPATRLSYGRETARDADPRTRGSVEPFYSSVRHKPNGWTIGVAGVSEVERVFHETVPVAVRSGEEDLATTESLPQSLSARWTGRNSVRVTWSEPIRDLHWVEFASAEGANSTYTGASGNVSRIVDASGVVIGVDVTGLRPGGSYRIGALGQSPLGTGRNLASDIFSLKGQAPPPGSPSAPFQVGAVVTGADSIRLHWRDDSRPETGYEVWYRKWSGDAPDEVWRRYGEKLPAGTRQATVRGLAAEETLAQITQTVRFTEWSLHQGARIGRYSFVVVAFNDSGWSASETFHLEFMPGPYVTPTARGDSPDCAIRPTGIILDGFEVYACVETPDGARRRAWDYGLEADHSGLLYFFDRDNAEVLVKVLDGCAINGHHWVFVAPVTDLPFRLRVLRPDPLPPPGTPPSESVVPRSSLWSYDSERRPQEQIWRWGPGNPKGRTARTVSDTTAFPCTAAEIRGAMAGRSEAGDGSVPSPGEAPQTTTSPVDDRRLSVGSRTDCEPGVPTLTLRGGYTVSMCYETSDGRVGDARDWGLDSSQSALLYFFQRNNAEVLIKVLDGCGVNGNRWVFVAPVTDLAFNLRVESPDGEVWTHTNRLGQTADAASNTSAFPCAASS